MFSKFFQSIQEKKQGRREGGRYDYKNSVPETPTKANADDDSSAKDRSSNKSNKTGGGGGGLMPSTGEPTAAQPTEPRKRRRGKVKDGVKEDRLGRVQGGGGIDDEASGHRHKRPRIHEVDKDNSKDQRRHEPNPRNSPNHHQQHHHHYQQQRPGQDDSNQKHHQQQQQQQKRRNHSQHQNHQPRQPRLTPAAYELSQQLQQASKHKQLQHALDLYLNFQPQSEIDNFHTCIVVDCCARCGHFEMAEHIVQQYASLQLQQQQNADSTSNNVSAGQAATLSVQVQTALLKAYAHAGAMHKASQLFHDIVSPFVLLLSSSSLKQQQQQMPNVRTLNTLLRGCLWTATTTYSTKATTVSGSSLSLAGGVISSEEAWALYQQYCNKTSSSNSTSKETGKTASKKKKKQIKKDVNTTTATAMCETTSFDVSSYEASIKLLFQALRMTPGQERLNEFMQRFGIQIKKQSRIIMTQNNNIDAASTLETLAVCFLAQAHAFAWLSLLSCTKQDDNGSNDDGNNNKDLWLACQRAIHAVQASRKVLQHAEDEAQADNEVQDVPGNGEKETFESSKKKMKEMKQPQIQGGKQAFKKESSPWTNKSNLTSTTNTTTTNDNNDAAVQKQQQQRIQEERRAASNVLYRKHRLDEIELEAKRLLTWRSQHQQKSSAMITSMNPSSSQSVSSITDFMQSKFFFFSSGGSTTTTTTTTLSSSSTTTTSLEHEDDNKKKARVDDKKHLFQHQQELLIPAWYSFGLGELLALQEQQVVETKDKNNNNNNDSHDKDDADKSSDNPTTVAAKTSLTTKQLKHHFTCFLQKRNSKEKKQKQSPLPSSSSSSSCLRADGSLDLDQVFPNAALDKKQNNMDIDIELGSGFGDWIVPQAMAFPHRNHIAVELRADRVYSILTKACTTISSSQLLLPSNLCTVACEARSFLEQRLLPHAAGRIATIFVNHPEPPTQTVGQHQDVAAAARAPRQGGTLQTNVEEEAAHMLNRSTLIAAARCLIPGRGRLVIVTDNSWYARLLCNTLVQIMVDASSQNHKNNKSTNGDTSIPHLTCATQSEMTGFHCVETFGNNGSNNNNNKHSRSFSNSPSVTLYKGQPNASIGHFTSNDGEETSAAGSSYFDRLWRTGAGRHAEKTTRFIVCIKRSVADK